MTWGWLYIIAELIIWITVLTVWPKIANLFVVLYVVAVVDLSLALKNDIKLFRNAWEGSMKNRFWKLATIYLTVGLLWGSFAAQKGLDRGFYEYEKESPHVVTVTVLANALLWPIAFPIGAYRIISE